ncbi:MAG: family 2 glycosyl transferase [Candidatus Berkelbacteria bacterium Gr01-1014_85]|uniref:dolichyl-phosphate beta-glucosyltransferase n=1 Tax=Candidatus Berkelbacteria bacterium Gr01-1014_85 TaxID=2017150 RepID=A0A554JE09_9BACT|nr:MAG: family 2 glycosyl transferase [Candidatus Berkelbacteria bacterium Gr01-1014_85]
MPKKYDLSVVIPAYNESQRIVPTLTSIQKFASTHHLDCEIIVVDDGSTDATEAAVSGLVQQYIKQKLNMGKGAAIRRGMLAANGKLILFMDADSSAPITELPALLTALEEVPIAIGSRHAEGSVVHIQQSLMRQFISYAGNQIFRLVLGLPYADTQCGFKLFTRQAAQEIFQQTLIDRWGFDVEVLTIARILGLPVREVPIQ